MSTTAILVEHLISGLQAAVWITLLLFAVFGYDWVNLDLLKDFAGQVAVAALAVVYPIGIFVDDLADWLFGSWSEQIRKRRFLREGINPSDRNVTAFYLLQKTKDDFLTSYFNYIRMRIRISRSAAVNFAACTVAGVAFTLFRVPFNWRVLLVELVVGLALISLAIWAWYRVSDTFAKQLSRVFKAQDNNDSTADAGPG